MPPLSATASDIGHGRLGLRSGLRTFRALVKESVSAKHAFVDLFGGKFITGWSVHSGSVYKATVNEVFRGRRLDVAMVRTPSAMLTRVEAIADVVAGTFYFDADSAVPSPVYLRLPDSSNPANTAVLGLFGFHFSNVRAVQPMLGPDKLVDGALEVWTSSTNLTNWTEVTPIGASNTSCNQDSSVVAEGAYSARLQATCVPGAHFRIDNDFCRSPR